MLKNEMVIKSKAHDYNVNITQSLVEALELLSEDDRAYYLVDKMVYELYKDDFQRFVPTKKLLLISATEYEKSFDSIGQHFMHLIESGLKKNHTLVVVGGGILQDIGCFIASVMYRGIRWNFIPTTLLSQCDSCIGSKSSLNIGSFKNQLGTFYPPHRICVPIEVLKTLKPDDIRSGIGEAIKIALIDGPGPFNKLMDNLEKFKVNFDVISEVIWSALVTKKKFIEEDEFDQGVRNLLNYGHTFGHAYESSTRYRIPHGLAVLIGVSSAMYFSEKLEFMEKDEAEEINKLIRPYYDPYQKILKSCKSDELIKALKSDKKNTGNSDVTFVLTKGIGKMERVILPVENVQRYLSAFIETL